MAVSMPPTCARNSTVSTAENWPRRMVVLATVSRRGELTVTRGGGGSDVAGVALLRHALSPAPREPRTARTTTVQVHRLLFRRPGGRPPSSADIRAAISGSRGVIWDIGFVRL